MTDVIEVCDDDSGKIDSVDGGVDCDVDFSEDGGKDGVKVEWRTYIGESLSRLKIFNFSHVFPFPFHTAYMSINIFIFIRIIFYSRFPLVADFRIILLPQIKF